MIPTLQTERLIMRPFEDRDLDPLAEWFATPASAILGGPMSRSLTWRGIAMMMGHWMIRGFGMWALEDRKTGAFVGRCGPWYPEAWPEREIGWLVLPSAEGRGYAFEAAHAARDYAYKTLGWTTAISLIAADNLRSQALAKRLGAVNEAPFVHPEFGDMEIWRHPGPQV